ncbi:hypothetical protein [Bacteroides sp.]|uniref:hypothetical protein n=1 Tax=Bacteroides sp. TaxID=29523 RepID=UPI002FC7B46A
MKKIVFLSLFALALPLVGMMAQSNDDDLYFIPSKEKAAPAPVKRTPAKREVTTNIYTSPGTTVVVQDRKGKTRDIDEYNRRYEARDNEFVMEDDTLFVQEKARPDLDGEWVNGEFNGSREDYEYAERIIRFRNPRYAISISSPLYWDVVYGSNSWDWNVYSDGLYAYAFPTFSNRLWWDWRFNSYGSSWGFGFGSPYYAGSYWGGWYGGYWGGGWGGYWGHHHHGYYPGWGGGGHYPSWGGGSWDSNRVYTNRRSSGRSEYSNGIRRQEGSSIRGEGSSTRRVVGTRTSTGTRSYDRSNSIRVEGNRQGVSSGRDASTRRSTYTRPSSTRSSAGEGVRREMVRSSSESTRSYNRGSSTSMPSRSSSTESTRRSYDNSSNSRSYTPSSGSSSRSSSSYSGGGGSSSRSSSGGGGSSRSSSGSSRR